MTVESRLGKLEASLSPTQLVVRWLDEAHGFGSLEAYFRALREHEAGLVDHPALMTAVRQWLADHGAGLVGDVSLRVLSQCPPACGRESPRGVW